MLPSAWDTRTSIRPPANAEHQTKLETGLHYGRSREARSLNATKVWTRRILPAQPLCLDGLPDDLLHPLYSPARRLRVDLEAQPRVLYAR